MDERASAGKFQCSLNCLLTLVVYLPLLLNQILLFSVEPLSFAAHGLFLFVQLVNTRETPMAIGIRGGELSGILFVTRVELPQVW